MFSLMLTVSMNVWQPQFINCSSIFAILYKQVYSILDMSAHLQLCLWVYDERTLTHFHEHPPDFESYHLLILVYCPWFQLVPINSQW